MTVGERLVAHHGLRHEQLHVAGTVAHRGEDQLAGIAQEHDAPGDADPVVGLGPRLQATPRGPQIAEVVRAVEPVRVRIGARGPHPVDQAQPAGALGCQAAAGPRPPRLVLVGQNVICHGGSTVASSRRRGVSGSRARMPAGAVDSLRSSAVRRLTALLLLGAALLSMQAVAQSPTVPTIVSGATATARAVRLRPPVIDIVTVNNSGELTAANASAALAAARDAGAAAAIGRSASIGMTEVTAGAQRRADRSGRLRLSDGRHRAAARDGGEHDGPVDLGTADRRHRGDGPVDRRACAVPPRATPSRSSRRTGTPTTVTVALVADDATLGGTELLMSPAAADRLGVVQSSSVVIWNSVVAGRDRCRAVGPRSGQHHGQGPAQLGTVRPGLDDRDGADEAGARRVRLSRQRRRFGDARPHVAEHVHHLRRHPGAAPVVGMQRAGPARAAGGDERSRRLRARRHDQLRRREHGRRLLRAAVQPADPRLVGRVPLPPHAGDRRSTRTRRARARAVRRPT